MDFKVIEEFKPNEEIIELIKMAGFNYRTKKGKITALENSNIIFIHPTIYLIYYPIDLTILEYKLNEISNKPIFIKEKNQKYSYKELKDIIKAWVEIFSCSPEKFILYGDYNLEDNAYQENSFIKKNILSQLKELIKKIDEANLKNELLVCTIENY